MYINVKPKKQKSLCKEGAVNINRLAKQLHYFNDNHDRKAVASIPIQDLLLRFWMLHNGFTCWILYKRKSKKHETS